MSGFGLPKLHRPGTLGLKSGFESPDLDRPGRQLHQQGLSEARLGCRDAAGSPPKRAPELETRVRTYTQTLHVDTKHTGETGCHAACEE